MEKKTNFTIWYFVITILIILSLQRLYNRPHMENLQYSRFRSLIEQKKLKDLVITSDAITGLVAEEALIDETSKEQMDEKTKLQAEEKLKTESAEKGWHNFTTTRVEDPDLINTLRENSIDFKGKIEDNWLSSFLSWILPLFFFFGIWVFLARRMGGGMQHNLMSIGKSNAKVYVEKETHTRFSDVACFDEAEEELKEVVEYLKTPQKFQRLGGKIPKGVLLVGPPGTGKTLLAKAVAGEAAVPFFRMNGSEFVEMFVGVGAARVRDLFHQASEKAPCIIFIDELDALGKARGINPVGGNDEREQTLNQLLVEMDGFDTNRAVIIMGATNRPETLDMALLRPGRFDRQVLVDRPDINGRESILKIHIRDIKLSAEVDLHIVAARTPGFAGADLANLVNEAALLAARKDRNEVTMFDFEEAIDRIVGGLEKKSRIMNSKEKERVAYHESGHALIAELTPDADPVHKISIIPRGIAALGYTMQLPENERYLLTLNELLDRLAVLLGGRAAEDVIFGEISTGAQNDLQRATDIARSMVKQYGMSDELGPVFLEPKRRSLFLKEDFAGEREYSEETARAVDNEVKRLITETYDKVKNMLTGNKLLLEKLAHRLLEKEVLEGEELRRLLGIQQTEILVDKRPLSNHKSMNG